MTPSASASSQPSNKMQLQPQLHVEDDSASATGLPCSNAYSTWLAANAMLLRSLNLPDPETPEDAIAQGLNAAVAAAATAHAVNHSDSGGRLPLQSLTCNIPTSGSVVCSLASAAQLTSLWLRLAIGDFAPTFREALSSLGSLCQLTLGMYSSERVDGDHDECNRMSRALLPALQHLTQLTHLSLTPDLDAECSSGHTMQFLYLPDDCGHFLPTSLVCLGAYTTGAEGANADDGTYLDLGHLTAVSTLRLVNLCQDDVLPPNVEALTLHSCATFMPLLPAKLPRLRQLDVDNCIFDDHNLLEAGDLQQLRQLTQLVDLRLKLGCVGPHTDGGFVLALLGIASLPVSILEFSHVGMIPVGVLDGLGAFSKLTRLSLTQTWESDWDGDAFDIFWKGAAVSVLASQLPRLSALQELQLLTKPADPSLGAMGFCVTDWQGFLQALVKLPSLRHVELSHFELGAEAVELCGATQLTRLVLRDCVVPQDLATKEALRSGLKQLMPEGLTICP